VANGGIGRGRIDVADNRALGSDDLEGRRCELGAAGAGLVDRRVAAGRPRERRSLGFASGYRPLAFAAGHAGAAGVRGVGPDMSGSLWGAAERARASMRARHLR
jgi:hypothetical protein